MKELRLLLIICMLLLPLCVRAQYGYELSENGRTEAINKITNATQAVKSIRCDFVQTKHSVMLAKDSEAKGTMDYDAPSKLQWTYVSPVAYVLHIDGDHVSVDGGNSAANRQVKAMSRLIMGCVNGNQLFDERLFDIQLFDNGMKYNVLLTPKRKDMQHVFKDIVFCFDKSALRAESICINERSGDTTTIYFNNVVVRR